MFLPDIHIWIALTFNRHAHHFKADAWFRGRGKENCLFCRMTQQGFLRIATNPKALAEDVVNMSKAWELYDTILSDPRIEFVAKPAGMEKNWRESTRGESFSPKIWNDAYLAAFAQSAGYQLVTFDKGFSKFDELDCLVLG